MGNRAIVHFTSESADLQLVGGQRVGVGFSVYQQWGADDVKAWLKEAAPSLRRGDAGYAAARWIGYLCEHHYPVNDRGQGYSVSLVDETFDPENGLYVVNCDTGTVTLFRDHAAGLARCGRPFKIKMGAY